MSRTERVKAALKAKAKIRTLDVWSQASGFESLKTKTPLRRGFSFDDTSYRSQKWPPQRSGLQIPTLFLIMSHEAQISGDVFLYSVTRQSDGEIRPLQIHEGVSVLHMNDFNDAWQNEFYYWYGRIGEQLRLRGDLSDDALRTELQQSNLGDIHWDWGGTVARSAEEMAVHVFSAEVDGQLEGLMAVEILPDGFRSEGYEGLSHVYVDRLAAAPWNRVPPCTEQRYRGVGLALITTAITVSLENECEGRLALHALATAADFYKKIGMRDLGADADFNGHLYFELPSSLAMELVTGKTS